ncbi:Cell division protein FtsL [Candidatus Xiphinematobacter sp. Idaho Grape]|uniref:hypothetical protein n=1 Tax=Candidatus Xiphinematobacter sp. Idaho Grape TaxID=1704307 RepID=UPI0007064195|nr:hypothetical protein [Candidatus Xiphinematobacter sp. Idaho Grape]ALJ56527.1 Cell division protein FtsL [Candidatus Xiphinematobacter sp. Idaho Grape]
MNTKKSRNSIEPRPIFQWTLIALVLGGVGLQVVYLKNQQFQLGQNIRKLERSLCEVHIRNQVLLAEIATLSSRSAVLKKLESMAIIMHAIQDQCITRLPVPEVSRDGVRTALNEELRQ